MEVSVSELDAPLLLSSSTGNLLDNAPKEGAYGMRTLRSLRNSKPSGRLQKKIDLTYNYFLEEVDPIIGDCITHLLCAQPTDVPAAMLAYLKKKSADLKAAEEAVNPNSAPSSAEDPTRVAENEAAGPATETAEEAAIPPAVEERKRPKKEQKLYLAMSIGPVVAKLVNRVAITRPKRVIDFLCKELNSMIFGAGAPPSSGDVDADEVDDRFAAYGTFIPGKKPYEPSIPPTDALEQPEVALFPASDDAGGPGVAVAEEPQVASASGDVVTQAVVATVETKVVVTEEEPKPPLRNLQLAILGMDNAGKSSILNVLEGKSDAKTRPTIGFRPIAMMLNEDTRVRFYDLGGGERIRDIWSQYYHDVHAVVYVFDASDEARLQSAVSLFKSTIKNAFLSGKPLLIFCNKQDVPGAKKGSELAELLNLAADFPSAQIVECCANSADATIEKSLEELLALVQDKYELLNERVELDTKQKTLDEAKKRLERERKVLRNKIAAAFPDDVDPKFKPDLPASPEDSFTMDEGHTFLAAEIGEDVAGLPSVALELAHMVGYQRLALQIIGALKAPISKKKEPLAWDEILALVVDLRTELGLAQ